MTHYKKFVYIFSSIALILILFHFIAWNMYTKYVFPKDYNIGDLGRMSYQIDSLFPRTIENTLPKQHMESYQWDGENVDVLTLGDSFSNGGGVGKNTYYQDYIATYNNFSVLNIKQLADTDNYLNTIIILYNSGFFDKVNVKYILIESVERESVRRFIMKTDLNLTLPEEEINKNLYSKKNIFHTKPKDSDTQNFITNLNFNAVKYNFLYNFKDNAYLSKVYKHNLSKEMFTSKKPKILLNYKDDLNRLYLVTKENIDTLNKNFNKVANLLKNKGIKLYFMPAVDKYDLYSGYIVNNKYPKNNFFKYLRELPKDYIFIDTKKILLEELKKGEKDIFYSDDTHWSYKASEAIFKRIKFD